MSLTYLSSAERRAREILEAYGSSPTCWPAEERQATLDCIAHSPALQQYQAQLADLDQCIRAELAATLSQASDVAALHQRILARLPAQSTGQIPGKTALWHRVFNWLATPRFAFALTGFLVIAVAMMMPRSPSPLPGLSPQATAQYADWSWYDITGQDLPAASSTTSLTMTDLIDLELDEDGG